MSYFLRDVLIPPPTRIYLFVFVEASCFANNECYYEDIDKSVPIKLTAEQYIIHVLILIVSLLF